MAFGLRSLVAAVGLLAAMPLSLAASFQQVPNFGTNPTSATMYIYVPDTLPAKPAVIVGIHWCSGTASAFYSGTQYAAKAAALGYIVIYPNAGTSDGCWDVASDATLTHDGGSHSKAIKTMVDYVLKTYNADASRVYATGVSSGAMMTNVLLATYPDVFAAGSAFAGVPYHCFAGPTSWNSNCAQGLITKTAQEWGDLARAAYPGYTGKRPKMQLFHGDKDEVLSFVNHGEAIKQWTNVLGISSTPTKSETNVPQTGWTRNIYGAGLVEAVVEVGLAHNLVVLTDEALRFFGLTGTSTTPTSSVSTTSPTATPTGGLVAKWGQCGGIGYTGSTTCVSGTTCTVVNPYYSQCL